MPKRQDRVGQFELFGTPASAAEANSEPERLGDLPVVFAQQSSHSALSTLERCPRSYWLRYPGGWRGWEFDAADETRRHYWWSRTKGWKAWAGVLVHDFGERYFYNIIDSQIAEQTGASPCTVDELRASLRERFEGEWQQSKSWTANSFRKASRDARSVWLIEHARGQWPGAVRGGNSVNDERQKRKCWHWVNGSVERFVALIDEVIAHAPIEHWLLIEGRRVENGIIVVDEADKPQAQAVLREAPSFPKSQLIVEGESWDFGWAMDFMTWCEDLGKYMVLEFKSGTPSYWKSHRSQLASYAALAIRDGFSVPGLPPFTEKNILLRSFYTSPDVAELSEWEERAVSDSAELVQVYRNVVDHGYLDWEMDGMSAAAIVRSIVDQLAKQRQHLLRLDELEPRERHELAKMLSPSLFSGAEGLFDKDVHTIRDGVDPGLLIGLKENYPPQAAISGQISICASCDQREGCEEGLRALAVDKTRL